MRDITDIVIHCSATAPSKDIGVKEIDAMHKARGWSGIGYHAVIRRNGQIETGRPLEKVGAHVKGHNTNSIGICMVGGVMEDGKTPDFNYTRAQLISAEALLNSYAREFPNAERCGHRDFPEVHKACPCFDVGEYFGRPVIG